MPASQPRFEEAGGHRLPLGGVNGYAGVRGKQGRSKDKFQGVTPKKQHRTAHFDEPQEAAPRGGVARASGPLFFTVAQRGAFSCAAI